MVVATTTTPARAAQAREPSGKTVWDGVYTNDQASRGRAQYEMSCRACHRGGPRTGDDFMRDWSGTDLKSLFGQIKASMPASAPSSLSDAAYLDIVAYMLQANAFPAGGQELDAEGIQTIRVAGRNGPEAVPNFALVRTVGCLAQRSDASWLLADASEPVRTKNPEASADDELRDSRAAALGTGTFQLMNVFPAPDRYKGHRVEAKGLLIREPGGNRINVTSVQTLEARCDKAK